MRALNTSKGPGLQPPNTSLFQMVHLGGGHGGGNLRWALGFSKPGWSCWFLVLTSRNHRVTRVIGGFLKKVLLIVVPYTKCYVAPKIRCYITYILLTCIWIEKWLATKSANSQQNPKNRRGTSTRCRRSLATTMASSATWYHGGTILVGSASDINMSSPKSFRGYLPNKVNRWQPRYVGFTVRREFFIGQCF